MSIDAGPLSPWRRGWLVAAAAVALLAGCGGGSDSSTDSATTGQSASASSEDCAEVAVGVFGPLTGSSAVYGQAGLTAVNTALGDYEERTGCTVEVVQFDSQGDPAAAPALAREIIDDQNIVAVLGPTFSGELEAAAPILEAGAVPFITSVATDPTLSTNGWQFFHRTIANDGQEAPADAEYIVDELQAERVAVIDNGQTYGKGLGDAVRAKLRELGAKVVDSESVDANRNDYASTVTKIAASNADVVFCGCLYPEAARLLKQLRAAGHDTQFMGGSGILLPEFVKQAGEAAAEGAIAASAGVDPSLSDEGKEWLKAWQAANGDEEPGLFAPEWFNSAVAVTSALEDGSTSREAIQEWLGGASFDGAVGTVEFSENGDIKTAQVNFYVVKNGTFQFQTSLQQE